MNEVSNLALAGGLAWASGIRLYATLFLAGLLGRLGYVDLPPGLAVLSHDWVLVVSGVLMVGEFLADKIPVFDSVWDSIQTFVRIPVGTLLAWGVFKNSGVDQQIIAALLGGAVVTGTHLAKSGGRALINTSPEPFSNWGASAGEDVSLLGIFYLMIAHPVVLLVVLALFLLLLCWLLPKIVRGLRVLVQRLRGVGTWLSGNGKSIDTGQ
ncbi:DUF4126 domain-containing protein [Dyella mobilis]|uniref:DUF4126 domain-containing protein n=1 Tax=Dyella mobilis TaxID=1849582 RepID=A0ABS2KPA0_9GAMM|nr:DUF4126 domain-containing protein [Dyella mobilis]MBM7132293.1 DUF4126 domain-containing protein [Dyella mobilis]GLQ95720.1 hypothetical protein GCM10007863_01380 [Dyella mobilis]